MLQYLFNILSAPDFLNTTYSRCFIAFFVALIITIAFGNRFIKILRAKQSEGQPIRKTGPESHLRTKKGTPTMGGLLILGSSIISILFSCCLANPLVWVCVMVLVIFGFVGFVDDYVKVTKQTENAMTAKMKLILQFSTSLAAVGIVSFLMPEDKRFVLTLPYMMNLAIDLWWFYVPFAVVVIVGSSNAVNLTDGLDGLASGLLVFAFLVFMIFAYIVGSDIVNNYYLMPIANAGEVAVVCAAVIGSCLGFLWFNTNPAKVFMGDTGSLALGGLLGTISVILKLEILLVVVGFVFVIEAMSVMAQVFWFRKTGGKRLFKMAPIHHHFEQLGWSENKVVIRFWVIGIIAAIVALLALQMK